MDIIIQGKWKNNILNTYYVSDGLLIVKIHAQAIDIYTIQIYYPITSSQDVEIENMYERIEHLMN